MSKDKKPCGSHVCGNCHLSNENKESNCDSSGTVGTNPVEHSGPSDKDQDSPENSGIQVSIFSKVYDLLSDHIQNLGLEDAQILSFKVSEYTNIEPKYSYQIYQNHAIIDYTDLIQRDNNHAISVEAKLRINFEGEYTFAIIKPDAYGDADKIIEMMESAGLKIAMIHKKPLKFTKHLSHSDVARFYAVHSHRDCFPEMCDFMSSGKCMMLVLCGIDAIKKYRTLMGATDPLKAEKGTIRTIYGGKTIGTNAVHGSDSPESVVKEMEQFFPGVLEKL